MMIKGPFVGAPKTGCGLTSWRQERAHRPSAAPLDPGTGKLSGDPRVFPLVLCHEGNFEERGTHVHKLREEPPHDRLREN